MATTAPFRAGPVRRAAASILIVTTLAGCGQVRDVSSVATVESFRAARASGDLEAASAYLAPDPRVWYDEHTGDGLPWSLGAGRWKAWDDHFNGQSDLGPWHAEDGTVWAVATETNDYYRLIERQGESRYRITYFLDDAGRITGYMISAADPDKADPPSDSRFDEFEAWVLANHPEEWADLRPGGRLDPTGDRAPRTRALLNEWRASVGLPRIE
jgi:hypothetical protein